MKTKKYNKSEIKNYYKWQELLKTTEGKFVKDIIDIKKEMGLPLNTFDSDESKPRDIIKERKLVAEFIHKLEPRKQEILGNKIGKILIKYNLWFNWMPTILHLIILDSEIIPCYNLGVSVKDNRILLELNPNTSLNEIKEAWSKIEILKKIYPQQWKKRLYYNKKKLNNMEIVKKDWVIRMDEPFGEISEYMSEFYRLNDLDRIGKIFVDNENEMSNISLDKKRVDKVRVLRHRSRKKIT